MGFDHVRCKSLPEEATYHERMLTAFSNVVRPKRTGDNEQFADGGKQ